MKKPSYKTADRVFKAGGCLSILLFLISFFAPVNLEPLGVAVLIAAAVFCACFYRCPHCGRFLNLRHSSECCDRCGQKLTR